MAPAISYQVNTLGGVTREDDLLALASVDEASYFHASLFHFCRRFFADLVDSTMNIGVSGFVISTHGLDDGIRLLRTRRAVKINQRLTVYLAREDWKVLANFCRRTYRRSRFCSLLRRCDGYVIGNWHTVPDFFITTIKTYRGTIYQDISSQNCEKLDSTWYGDHYGARSCDLTC